MDYRVLSMIPMLLWGLYAIFASLAVRIHGERVTMSMEAIAMMAVAVLMLLFGGSADFALVTRASFLHGAIMAVMSAVGLMVQFYLFRIAPRDGQGTVVLINGLFPVVACVLFDIMGRLHLEGGSPMSKRQWLCVASGALTLYLASGK